MENNCEYCGCKPCSDVNCVHCGAPVKFSYVFSMSLNDFRVLYHNAVEVSNEKKDT